MESVGHNRQEGFAVGSEWTVAELCALRRKAVEEYLRVGDDRESWQLDLRAIAVELDRALTRPGDPASIEARAQRVAAALDVPDAEPTPLEPSQGRARAIRHESLMRRVRRDKPELFEEWTPRDREREEETVALIAAADAEGPREVRRQRRLVAALSSTWPDGSTPAELVRALAERPLPPDPLRVPAREGVTWTAGDWLEWEEFIDGVPCQGCGLAYFDRAMQDEAARRQDGRAVEPYDAWQARIRPLELERERAFRELHPDCGDAHHSYNHGPWHCDRCCPPPPLLENPEVQRALRAIATPAVMPVAPPPKVRHCGTCHKEIGEGHVCRLVDLPKRCFLLKRRCHYRWWSPLPSDDRSGCFPGHRTIRREARLFRLGRWLWNATKRVARSQCGYWSDAGCLA